MNLGDENKREGDSMNSVQYSTLHKYKEIRDILDNPYPVQTEGKFVLFDSRDEEMIGVYSSFEEAHREAKSKGIECPLIQYFPQKNEPNLFFSY